MVEFAEVTMTMIFILVAFSILSKFKPTNITSSRFLRRAVAAPMFPLLCKENSCDKTGSKYVARPFLRLKTLLVAKLTLLVSGVSYAEEHRLQKMIGIVMEDGNGKEILIGSPEAELFKELYKYIHTSDSFEETYDFEHKWLADKELNAAEALFSHIKRETDCPAAQASKHAMLLKNTNFLVEGGTIASTKIKCENEQLFVMFLEAPVIGYSYRYFAWYANITPPANNPLD